MTPDTPPHVHTVGHSNLSVERFVALLHEHGVTTVVDVRSTPYSRRFPWFARERLARSLAAEGIDYVHMGEALGGRPREADLYDAEGAPDYGRMRRTPGYAEGLAHLTTLARQRRGVCVMCSEGDARHCHRTHLLAPDLLRAGVDVTHIPRPQD